MNTAEQVKLFLPVAVSVIVSCFLVDRGVAMESAKLGGAEASNFSQTDTREEPSGGREKEKIIRAREPQSRCNRRRHFPIQDQQDFRRTTASGGR